MLGMKLKELRSQKGLTQTGLADSVGRTQQAVAMWETNRALPDVQTLQKLARYFGVSTDYLLGNDAPSTPDQNLQMYERLPAADRAAVNRMIAALFAQAQS